MEAACYQKDVVQQTLELLEAAIQIGVTEFCLCPGSRNSSFVSVVKRQPHLQSWYWFEERSAAFFALGRARQTKKPVAVVTTSGTAAGELLPAIMEAFYTHTPLLLITTDRPVRFRGTGAPQSAEQKGLFGCYTEFALDIDAESIPNLSMWDQQGPAHINICLEEPPKGVFPDCPQLSKSLETGPRIGRDADFLDGDFREFMAGVKAPLVLVSSLPVEDREAVVDFLVRLGCPVLLEGTSGIREDPRLSQCRVYRNDKIWETAAQQGYPIDSVLRIGGVPTIRLWRDLEDKQDIKVYSITHLPFSGLSRRTCVAVVIRDFVVRCLLPEQEKNYLSHASWLQEDKRFQAACYTLYEQFPCAEPSLVHQLSKLIPNGAMVYLGNSLPIREWDFAAQDNSKDFDITASRGLNGIDGQLSTFLGQCERNRENWGIFGDLTTLYDMAGPWILPQLDQHCIRFVVINNGGGKIFDRMFADVEIQNRHGLSFESFAKFWGVGYELWKHVPEKYAGTNHVLIEIVPDEGQTKAFWEKLKRM